MVIETFVGGDAYAQLVTYCTKEKWIDLPCNPGNAGKVIVACALPS